MAVGVTELDRVGNECVFSGGLGAIGKDREMNAFQIKYEVQSTTTSLQGPCLQITLSVNIFSNFSKYFHVIIEISLSINKSNNQPQLFKQQSIIFKL